MRFTGTPRFDEEPRRILVVQVRRIGDTLLATPALRALRRRFPGAALDVVVEPPCDEVLRDNPNVDRLLLSPRTGVAAGLRFLWRLRRGGYDWAIDFLSNPRSAQYTRASGASVRLGLDRAGRRWAYTHRAVETPEHRSRYAVDQKLALLEFLGVPSAGRELELAVDDPAERSRIDVLLAGHGGPVVAVATGPPNDAKRYPAASVARVVEGLRADGARVVLTSGPGEARFGEAVQEHLDAPVDHLAGARVARIAALYRRADLYLGPDSGPKHVAVAVGARTLTLFGPGVPTAWNPPDSPRNRVLLAPCDLRPRCDEAACARAGHLAAVPPEEVLERARELLATRADPAPR